MTTTMILGLMAIAFIIGVTLGSVVKTRKLRRLEEYLVDHVCDCRDIDEYANELRDKLYAAHVYMDGDADKEYKERLERRLPWLYMRNIDAYELQALLELMNHVGWKIDVKRIKDDSSVIDWPTRRK